MLFLCKHKVLWWHFTGRIWFIYFPKIPRLQLYLMGLKFRLMAFEMYNNFRTSRTYVLPKKKKKDLSNLRVKILLSRYWWWRVSWTGIDGGDSLEQVLMVAGMNWHCGHNVKGNMKIGNKIEKGLAPIQLLQLQGKAAQVIQWKRLIAHL